MPKLGGHTIDSTWSDVESGNHRLYHGLTVPAVIDLTQGFTSPQGLGLALGVEPGPYEQDLIRRRVRRAAQKASA